LTPNRQLFIGLLILQGLAGAQASPPASAEYTSWSQYGGSADSAQYSSLSQINRKNVTQLKIAWRFPTSDKSRYSFNPLQAHGLVYVMAQDNSIVALEAATGKQVWVRKTMPDVRLITNRGLNYWESSDGKDRRILFSEDNFLKELDARTGKQITAFGTDGKVDLRAGLGRDPNSIVLVQSTTPGRVFENLIILGSATNQEYESAPGDIRAYDILSGKLAWTFHTVPHPGEFGYDTWPKDAYKTVGGADAWGELSLDTARGVVYIPTGSAKYNFYGANRRGADLFADCLLALDARTGKRIWHYQMVHHDIWDYDDATGPKLLRVKHDGQDVDIVAEVSKQGFLWVFNRLNGKPLWPIEERPVPKSDMPGEETWPTQPFPVKPPPFSRQKFTADDLSPYIEDPQERARIRDEIQSARNEGLFTPPSTRGTIQMPGNNGGANWGGSAVDPTNGTLYVVSKDLPALLKLEPETSIPIPAAGSLAQQGLAVYQNKCQICHHADLKGQPPTVPSLVNIGARLNEKQVAATVTHGEGLMPAFASSKQDSDRLMAFLFSKTPVTSATEGTRQAEEQPKRYRSGFGFMVTSSGLSPIAPPWSSLTAYDLNEGTIKWKIPLGEVPELAAKGIKNTGSHFPKLGPVVTAGGLIFTGTRDGKVRALDEDNGRVLWEEQLPTGLEGIPAVFEANGKEYVVFCAAAQTSSKLLGTKGSPATQAHADNGAYVAFALP
jgi:quinoprotein glucose dehydrogenase